jgi:hypothetical protein
MVHSGEARKPGLEWVERLLAAHHYTTFDMAWYQVARLSADQYDILANGFEYE